MKKFIPLILIFSVFFSCSGESPLSEKDLGKKIFEAVKSQNANDLMFYSANETDIKNVVYATNIPSGDIFIAQKILKFTASDWNRNHQLVINEIYRHGKLKGIDWNKTVLDSSAFLQGTKEEQELGLYPLIDNGVAHMEILVCFHDEKDSHVLRLKDCIQSDRGWVLLRGLALE